MSETSEKQKESSELGTLLWHLDIIRPRLREKGLDMLRNLPEDWNSYKYRNILEGKSKNVDNINLVLSAAKKVLSNNAKYDLEIADAIPLEG